MNPQMPGLTILWAAADEQVDRYVTAMRSKPITTSDVAMILLANENDNKTLNLAIIAATALQRLAGQPQ